MAEVILALDLPLAEALPLLDQLPELHWAKVGPILFNREGPPLIAELRRRGLKVFLDLKWHDIPNTVAGAVMAARELDVSLATVHALGGAAMLEAARGAAGGELGLLGVTVLTSHDTLSYEAAVGRTEVSLLAEVARLAEVAVKAGFRGIVCSPLETEAVRRSVGTAPWIVVPGIRRPSDSVGDQARTASPAEAVRRGATHLVVGRPILQASDPASAFQEIRDSAEAR